MCNTNIKKILLSLFLLTLTIVGFAQNTQGPPATLVTAITAKTQPWQPHINSVGTLLAEQGIMIKPEVAGRVTNIHFKSGSEVEKGTLLIELNPEILAGSFEAAKAALKLATLNFNRTQNLFKQNTTSKSEFDKAAADLQSAQGEYEKAKGLLDQSMIRAPFTGTLGLRLVSVGDYVTAGQDLVNLQKMSPMLVDFAVPETYANLLKIGQPVDITPDSENQKTHKGTVRALDSKIDPVTRLLTVRAEIPNDDHQLTPGAFVDIDLFLGKTKPTMILPKIAVVYDDQGAFVYKVINDKAKKVYVKLGTILDDDIIVLDGVDDKDVIVTTGQDKIREGSLVSIAKSPSQPTKK